MGYHFDLVHEPWIPCHFRDGTRREVGLSEALSHAHEIAEIQDPSPLVTVALHRLLLAVLHRALNGPKDAGMWAAWWRRGKFEGAHLEEYFRHRADRFDLFSGTLPFYQCAGMPVEFPGGSYGAPISRLVHEAASGNNPTLFDHSSEENALPLTAAEVGRLLVATQAYAIGGLISFEKGQDRTKYGSADHAPMVKGVAVLATGDSLFETLMLNLVPYNAKDREPFAFQADKDRPAWERNGDVGQGDRYPDGYLDYLTWQSRRIKLLPETGAGGAVVVRHVVMMKGSQFPEGFQRHSHETMMAFRKKEKPLKTEDPWPAVEFREGRALWRDSLALIQSVAEKRERPKTLKWLDALCAQGYLERAKILPVVAMGLGSDRSAIHFWRRESLSLPLEILGDEGHLLVLEKAISMAESMGNLVYFATSTLASQLLTKKSPTDLSKFQKQDKDQLMAHLGGDRAYWSKLEVPFRRCLAHLASTTSPEGREALLAEWFEEIDGAARAALDSIVESAGQSARALRSCVKARGVFAGMRYQKFAAYAKRKEAACE